MRILIVSQVYYPYMQGGGAVKSRAIGGQLARRGHQVTVLTADLGHRDAVVEERSAVEAAYLTTIGRYRTATLNPGVVPFCLRRLREFQVVHIYGIYDLLGPVVAWFCRRWHIPYLVEPIGMYRPIVRSLIKKRLYHRLLGRAQIEGTALLIATSEQERRELVAEGLPSEKIEVRRNGLVLSEFENLPPRGSFRRELGLDDEPLVLSLGRLSRKKGLDLLVKAFARLTVPAHLAIAGPDDQDGTIQELKRLTTSLGLGDRVVLTGPRFGADRLTAYVDSDVFVLSSLNENFGNTAAEAVACGVPVIVTDRCGVAPFVRDRAGLVVPYDEDSLAEALRRILTDRELRERFQANTARVREELSWQEPIDLQERLYRSILAGGRATI